MTRLGLGLGVLLLVMPALSACDTVGGWFDGGNDTKTRVPGERISVLSYESQLDPDPAIAEQPMQLPRPWVNPDWPQSGGYPSHAMHHLALGESLRPAWTGDIGSKGDDYSKILAQPVVADGYVFTLDAETRVTAFEANTGRRLWRLNLTPKGEDSGSLGGGLAYVDGRLFVSTGYGDVLAVQPNTGLLYWHVPLKLPVRGSPTADGGRVFVVTQDNQLHAFEAETGRLLWKHAGLTETAGLLGSSSPAVEGGVVVAPYSSGELVALRVDTGTVAWQEQLVRTSGRINAIGALNEISARPVIDRGMVFAVSQSGRFVAIDLRSGERLWERVISSIQTPWVAGDYIFVITVDAEVMCLQRRDGKIKWIRQLRRYKDPQSKGNKGLINWYGPVLAGDRLLLSSTDERAFALSPYNGDLIGAVKLSAPAVVAPVVAGQSAYFLTEDARLSVFR